MDPTLIVAFLALGAVVGFLAGLLGIGGGMTMVPLLTSSSRARDSRRSTSCTWRSRRRPRRYVHVDLVDARASAATARCCGRWSPGWRRASSWARSSGRRSSARMSTALLSAFFGVFVAVGGDATSARSQAQAHARAARPRRPLRGRRRHRPHREHGRRGRRFHRGSVHDSVQRADAQLRRDVGGARLARRRRGDDRLRHGRAWGRPECRRTRSVTSTCRRCS